MTCGAPDNVFMGEEVHLYGLSAKQIEYFVRFGTPFPPDFIKQMEEDEFNIDGLRDTIQSARLRTWVLGDRKTEDAAARDMAQIGKQKCSNHGCVNEGTKKCSLCGSARYCGQECQRKHWREEHKTLCVMR